MEIEQQLKQFQVNFDDKASLYVNDLDLFYNDTLDWMEKRKMDIMTSIANHNTNSSSSPIMLTKSKMQQKQQQQQYSQQQSQRIPLMSLDKSGATSQHYRPTDLFTSSQINSVISQSITNMYIKQQRVAMDEHKAKNNSNNNTAIINNNNNNVHPNVVANSGNIVSAKSTTAAVPVKNTLLLEKFKKAATDNNTTTSITSANNHNTTSANNQNTDANVFVERVLGKKVIEDKPSAVVASKKVPAPAPASSTSTATSTAASINEKKFERLRQKILDDANTAAANAPNQSVNLSKMLDESTIMETAANNNNNKLKRKAEEQPKQPPVKKLSMEKADTQPIEHAPIVVMIEESAQLPAPPVSFQAPPPVANLAKEIATKKKIVPATTTAAPAITSVAKVNAEPVAAAAAAASAPTSSAPKMTATALSVYDKAKKVKEDDKRRQEEEESRMKKKFEDINKKEAERQAAREAERLERKKKNEERQRKLDEKTAALKEEEERKRKEMEEREAAKKKKELEDEARRKILELAQKQERADRQKEEARRRAEIQKQQQLQLQQQQQQLQQQQQQQLLQQQQQKTPVQLKKAPVIAPPPQSPYMSTGIIGDIYDKLKTAIGYVATTPAHQFEDEEDDEEEEEDEDEEYEDDGEEYEEDEDAEDEDEEEDMELDEEEGSFADTDAEEGEDDEDAPSESPIMPTLPSSTPVPLHKAQFGHCSPPSPLSTGSDHSSPEFSLRSGGENSYGGLSPELLTSPPPISRHQIVSPQGLTNRRVISPPRSFQLANPGFYSPVDDDTMDDRQFPLADLVMEDEEAMFLEDESYDEELVPAWAKEPNFSQALKAQNKMNVDPDTVFPRISRVQLKDIFSENVFRSPRNQEGNDSQDWTKDNVTKEENNEYKKLMGYGPGPMSELVTRFMQAK
ncbi:hypothetical protein SAMD00019534_017040 [Acytostelium subglobosum LB1]|uniref:hypothetical protein n=1 Tax=Acytostelium subglobosum LB1 TaxID=1410327 RepID=UPI0006449661|nr:hypothetical protein SAMD00019534_017040 [Acytostelium subglobosum LB1]GAM18529.1 hypothetical protein SAMD00019534_017040 [Acytostelium subglobosum LB1]|eukprot:XP_012757749.1 hypothetical protein SAMD00019534_017040 [Acytostelium subglobosum LB1]